MHEVTTQDNLPTAPPAGAWGAENTSREDLVIARIQLQHELSFGVKQGKAKPGEFVNSATSEVITKPIELIPISTFREWRVTDKNSQKLIQRVVVDQSNEHWTEESIVNGMPVIRTKTLNFFVMLTSAIDELPFLVSFKKSGMYAGKVLSTHFQVSGMKGLPPARTTFVLGSEQRTSNNKTYYAPTMAAGRPTTEAELAKAYAWYLQLNQSAVKVADETGVSEDGPSFNN